MASDLLSALMTLTKVAEKRRVTQAALLDAVSTLAGEICENTRAGDEVCVGPVSYCVVNFKSNVGSAKFLARTGRGLLEVTGTKYLHNDFSCCLVGADLNAKREFASHATEVVEAFAKLSKAEITANETATQAAKTGRV